MSLQLARGGTEGSGRPLPFPDEAPSCALPTLQAPQELTPSFFSLQWQREAGFLDLRARLRGDDVPGCWPGVGQLAAPRGKASHQRPWWHIGDRARLSLFDFYFIFYFFLHDYFFLDLVWC